MFDISFSEILLIFLLALIVLGPEKLPKVASQVGRWIGRARGMARQFREQLEEEVNLEEARKAQANRTPPPPADSPAQSGTGASATAAPQTYETTAASPQAQPAASPSFQPEGSPVSQPEASAHIPQPEPPQPTYRDGYSHAHPTDELGRPIPAANDPIGESGQQDWVGGVTADRTTQSTAAAAYPSSHERGT